MTIDEIDNEIQKLPPADREKLLARLLARYEAHKTPLQRILSKVNQEQVKLELYYLFRILEMRKEKRLASRDWNAQQALIRSRLHRELEKAKSSLDTTKLEYENKMNHIRQENADIVGLMRSLLKKKWLKNDEEVERILEKEYGKIEENRDRIDEVLRFLNEVFASQKRPSGKTASWINKYLAWRTGESLNTLKASMTAHRKSKRKRLA